MKKNHIIGVAVAYAVLFSGTYYYTSGIQPHFRQTAVVGNLARTTEQEDLLGVTQKILDTRTEASGAAQPIQIRNGETALDLIKRTHTVVTKDYDFGTLVESIDSVMNGTENKYWILYVNGKQASVGAGAYTIQKNDAIEWRFEAYVQ